MEFYSGRKKKKGEKEKKGKKIVKKRKEKKKRESCVTPSCIKVMSRGLC